MTRGFGSHIGLTGPGFEHGADPENYAIDEHEAAEIDCRLRNVERLEEEVVVKVHRSKQNSRN
jgi:hypothetical protein